MNLFEKYHVPGVFTDGSVVKNLPSNAGDVGLTPGRELISHIRRGN